MITFPLSCFFFTVATDVCSDANCIVMTYNKHNANNFLVEGDREK